MRRISRALVALALIPVGISAGGASAAPRLKLPPDYAAWTHVAHCEEGGWYAPGGFYPDALGINATNYAVFGGHPDHGHLSLVRQVAEIRVADKLIKHYGVGIPDQGGCHAW
jgi:hypothetical protein